MISQKKLSNTIKRIESKRQHIIFRYLGLDIWPVIRFAINYKRKYGGTTGKNHKQKSDNAARFNLFLLAAKFKKLLVKGPRNSLQFLEKNKFPKADVLFVSQVKQHILVNKEGVMAAPFLDQFTGGGSA